MYFHKRHQKYSFIYYDREKKTNVRLKQADCPKVFSDEEAELYCQQWNEKNKTFQYLSKQKHRWRALAPEFTELLDIYEMSRQEDAVYTWKNNVQLIYCYVFPYYLEILGIRDLNQWADHFETFREYLQVVPRIKKGKTTVLSFSSMNSVIKSLNSFLLIMHRRKNLKIHLKCRLFPKYKCGSKSEESVLNSKQILEIYQTLRKRCVLASQMFWVSIHTGLRLNELMGLSLPDLNSGHVDNEVLLKSLDTFPFEVFGYLSLDSQPKEMSNPRNESGEVPRKPLKGKRTISGAHSRTIPIFDSQCFDILVELWNRQREAFQKRKWGADPKNYLLFDGMQRKVFYHHLIKAQHDDSRIFTPHDSRHTYSTWLAEKSGGNFALCRMILGHSTLETTIQYVHMGARIRNQLKSKIQLQVPMAYSDQRLKTIPLFPDRKRSER